MRCTSLSVAEDRAYGLVGLKSNITLRRCLLIAATRRGIHPIVKRPPPVRVEGWLPSLLGVAPFATKR